MVKPAEKQNDSRPAVSVKVSRETYAKLLAISESSGAPVAMIISCLVEDAPHAAQWRLGPRPRE
jgi:hypothetical protein